MRIKEVFMNSSIQQFAACLLVYSKMIDKAVEINGEDAFIDNNIPECTISWLKEELKKLMISVWKRVLLVYGN